MTEEGMDFRKRLSYKRSPTAFGTGITLYIDGKQAGLILPEKDGEPFVSVWAGDTKGWRVAEEVELGHPAETTYLMKLTKDINVMSSAYGYKTTTSDALKIAHQVMDSIKEDDNYNKFILKSIHEYFYTYD